MNNPLDNKKSQILIPVLVGAAAAGALAYFLISEDTAELREELGESLAKVWDSFKDKAMEKVSALQSKVEPAAGDLTDLES
jgi:gas vesicle protein